MSTLCCCKYLIGSYQLNKFIMSNGIQPTRKAQDTYKYFALFIFLGIIVFILRNLIMQFTEVKNDSLWLRTSLNSGTIFK